MGLPIAFVLTGGEVSDFKGYLPVMNADGPAPKVQFGDKGYDADFSRQDMERRGGLAMIPTKWNRLVQLAIDAAIYALRNMVERCYNKLKNTRRLATRYDKPQITISALSTSSQSSCGCVNLSTPPRLPRIWLGACALATFC